MQDVDDMDAVVAVVGVVLVSPGSSPFYPCSSVVSFPFNNGANAAFNIV